MTYDPYGGQLPEQQMSNGDIVKDVLTAPLRPSTYLYSYMWPGAFSQKKGIMTPFETKGKVWKEEISNIRNSFKSGKIAGIKGTFGSLKRLGPFGKGHRIGQQFLNIDYKKRITNSKNLQKYHINKLKTLQPDVTTFRELKNQGFLKKRKLIVKGERLQHEYMKHKVASLKMGERIVESTKKLGLQRLAKLGIIGAKAGSVVGMAMLAWDLASLVAAPLAQAGMNVLNSAANTFQSRYMPEMGGQLQLSYLSQGAATERQRSIQAISKAYINGRSAFGQEGSLMHS